MKKLFEKFITNKDRIAIIENGNSFSYDQLVHRIKHFQTELSINNLENKVVCLHSQYSFDSIALFFALTEKRNSVYINIDRDKTLNPEKYPAIQYCDFIVSISENGLLNIENAIDQKIEDSLFLRLNNNPGLILTSSGTTGAPKIMLHDLSILVNTYRQDKIRNNRIISLLGFDHIGGLDIMLRSIINCSLLVLTNSYNPESICELIQSHSINVLPASPSFFRALLLSGVYQKYNLSSVEIIGFGSEPMPESTLILLKEVFPQAVFQQKFGTSETNALRIKNDSTNPLAFKIDQENTEIKVVENELWIKSPTQIIGYLSKEHQGHIQDGWFKTGDIVELSDEGHIKIIGRKNDIINVGGEKVFPTEVEKFILEIKGVIDCKVFGRHNPIIGQSVNAEVVTNQDHKEMKSLIINHCKEKLPKYKAPTRIRFVDSIEMSGRMKRKR